MGKETGSPSSSGLWLSDADVTLLQASRPHLGCKSPGPSTRPLLFVTCLFRATSSWWNPSEPLFLPLPLGSLLGTQKQRESQTTPCLGPAVQTPTGLEKRSDGLLLGVEEGKTRPEQNANQYFNKLSCHSSEITVAAERG